MTGRIVRSADFVRVLAAPTRARSVHFAIHHLAGAPSLSPAASAHKLPTELSTGCAPTSPQAVDDLPATPTGTRCWVGAVVPKRHAKRSVTRSLLKRQIRAAIDARPDMPAGLWVVRLRSPFALREFPSAASAALRDAARGELHSVLSDAVRRVARG